MKPEWFQWGMLVVPLLLAVLITLLGDDEPTAGAFVKPDELAESERDRRFRLWISRLAIAMVLLLATGSLLLLRLGR